MTIFLSALVRFGWAQTDTIPVPDVVERDFLQEVTLPDSLTGGKVNIHADPRLGELLKVRRDVYRQGCTFEGYRMLPVVEQDSVLAGDSLFLLLRDSLIPLPAVQEERPVRD